MVQTCRRAARLRGEEPSRWRGRQGLPPMMPVAYKVADAVLAQIFGVPR